jgi:hypothetical protein
MSVAEWKWKGSVEAVRRYAGCTNTQYCLGTGFEDASVLPKNQRSCLLVLVGCRANMLSGLVRLWAFVCKKALVLVTMLEKRFSGIDLTVRNSLMLNSAGICSEWSWRYKSAEGVIRWYRWPFMRYLHGCKMIWVSASFLRISQRSLLI